MNQSVQMVISVPRKMATTDINPHLVLSRKEIIQTLQTGEIEILGQPLAGSNSTLFVSCKLGDIELNAIYKPERGEMPLWDFPLHTLIRREVAAYTISLLIGWDFVPPTVLRTQNSPFGLGSLQLFIPHNPAINYFNLPVRNTILLQKIALFDIIINNADRKGGHLLWGENGKIWLIDHGVCFHSEYKLRTVIWDFANHAIQEPLINDLKKLIFELKSKRLSLARKIYSLLSSVEIDMIIQRAETLTKTKIFPAPDQDRRPYPWPLI